MEMIYVLSIRWPELRGDLNGRGPWINRWVHGFVTPIQSRSCPKIMVGPHAVDEAAAETQRSIGSDQTSD